jgi:hypothetical protein
VKTTRELVDTSVARYVTAIIEVYVVTTYKCTRSTNLKSIIIISLKIRFWQRALGPSIGLSVGLSLGLSVGLSLGLSVGLLINTWFS